MGALRSLFRKRDAPVKDLNLSWTFQRNGNTTARYGKWQYALRPVNGDVQLIMVGPDGDGVWGNYHDVAEAKKVAAVHAASEWNIEHGFEQRAPPDGIHGPGCTCPADVAARAAAGESKS